IDSTPLRPPRCAHPAALAEPGHGGPSERPRRRVPCPASLRQWTSVGVHRTSTCEYSRLDTRAGPCPRQVVAQQAVQNSTVRNTAAQRAARGAPVSLDQPLAPVPEQGMGFDAAWPVRAGDVDPYNRLRFDAVARYLQDIAWEQLHQTFLARTDPNWIVRRTVIDVVRPVLWPDDVRLLRWCSSMSTRWTNMRVRITSGNGGLIETEGFWINISESTGMPARISDEGLAYLSRSTDEHRLRWRP